MTESQQTRDETLTLPQSVQAALETWRNGVKYLGDSDAGASDPQEVWASAHRVVKLATAAGVSLQDLGVDVTERKLLTSHTLAHEDAEASEERGWSDIDSVPEGE